MTSNGRQPAGRFDAGQLRTNVLAGVTTGVVALPLALAFGEASGAGPVAGIVRASCGGGEPGGPRARPGRTDAAHCASESCSLSSLMAR